jgi:hypothetical protein
MPDGRRYESWVIFRSAGLCRVTGAVPQIIGDRPFFSFQLSINRLRGASYPQCRRNASKQAVLQLFISGIIFAPNRVFL